MLSDYANDALHQNMTVVCLVYFKRCVSEKKGYLLSVDIISYLL